MSSHSDLPVPDGRAPGASTQPYAAPAGFHETSTVVGRVPAPAGLPAELLDHPRYRVLRLLGSGGMGAVYYAEHRVMERPVALKVIRADLTADAAAVERFRREVRAAAALVHPHIVTAFDAEQIGTVHFLVMEYVEGIDLARHVAARGPLGIDEACSHARQAALGLQHAFEKGMIHRDIKPHNLILTTAAAAPRAEPFGRVKVLDFGLARLAGAPVRNAQTVSGMILGTVDFMAPEQADDARTVDIRADIYSLGCTLYYLLTGRVLFPGGTMLQKVVAMMERQPPPLTRYRPDAPPLLLNVVSRMLAKKPDDRYQTPADVANVLTPFLDGQALSVPVAEPFTPTLEEHLPLATLIEEVEPVPERSPAPRRSSATELLPRLVSLVAPGPGKPIAQPWSVYAIAVLVGVMLLLTGAGWLGYLGFNRVLDSFSNTPRHTWAEVNRTWKPPPDDAADTLFPSSIGKYKRENVDDLAALPLLGIDKKGRRGRYRDFWQIELCVYRVSAAEKEAIYRKAMTILQAHDKDVHKNTVRTGFGDGPLLVYEFHAFNLNNMNSDMPKGALWYKDGWLFVMQAENTSGDPETLLLKYLEN